MLDAAITWLYTNQQWVFDGFGVAVVAGLFTWWRSRKSKEAPSSQTQRAGSGSTNIQAGRDANVTLNRKGDRDA